MGQLGVGVLDPRQGLGTIERWISQLPGDGMGLPCRESSEGRAPKRDAPEDALPQRWAGHGRNQGSRCALMPGVPSAGGSASALP